ncbi:hypothetical protein T492DRAFT_201293 [Pavlovales sp. CCMP2436]|nr:hypothetical protein T492DRAFT_201293 [Pavlovales sp. CCMP2436]
MTSSSTAMAPGYKPILCLPIVPLIPIPTSSWKVSCPVPVPVPVSIPSLYRSRHARTVPLSPSLTRFLTLNPTLKPVRRTEREFLGRRGLRGPVRAVRPSLGVFCGRRARDRQAERRRRARGVQHPRAGRARLAAHAAVRAGALVQRRRRRLRAGPLLRGQRKRVRGRQSHYGRNSRGDDRRRRDGPACSPRQRRAVSCAGARSGALAGSQRNLIC